eukprot:gene9754-9911_t
MQHHFDEDLAELAAGPGAPSQVNQTQAAHVDLTDSLEILIHNMLDQAARRRLYMAVNGCEDEYRAALRHVATLCGFPAVYDADEWSFPLENMTSYVEQVLEFVMRRLTLPEPPVMPLQSYLGGYLHTERFVYLFEALAAQCVSNTVHGQGRTATNPVMLSSVPFGDVAPMLQDVTALQSTLLSQLTGWGASTPRELAVLRSLCLRVLRECGVDEPGYRYSRVQVVMHATFHQEPGVVTTMRPLMPVWDYPLLQMRTSFNSLENAAASSDLPFVGMAMPQLLACTMLMVCMADQYHLSECTYGMRLRLAVDSLQLLQRVYNGTQVERAPAAVAALPASAQPVVSPDGERIRILEAQLEAQADRIHQLEEEATRMLQIASQLQEMQEAHRHRRQRT